MPPLLIVALIVFLAVFVQATAGFGLALVSMPLLTAVIGLPAAAPMMAVIGMAVELVLLLRFREAVNMRAVRGLVIAALIGTPLGLFLLRVIDPAAGARLLGLLVAGYALYALTSPPFAHVGSSALGMAVWFCGRRNWRPIQHQWASSDHLWQLPPLASSGIQR
ncbi:MAG: sulfite exporter TauE/SafE family protein [Anaerolineae bacterium]|nr:sulfite exporter TauE/SafE family protein [Anaerolineae bacterium]